MFDTLEKEADDHIELQVNTDLLSTRQVNQKIRISPRNDV